MVEIKELQEKYFEIVEGKSLEELELFVQEKVKDIEGSFLAFANKQYLWFIRQIGGFFAFSSVDMGVSLSHELLEEDLALMVELDEFVSNEEIEQVAWEMAIRLYIMWYILENWK